MKKTKHNDKPSEKLNEKRAERLYECRTQKNLTQYELARLANYNHQNTISQLERCERDLTWDKAKNIGKALDISPEYLMCETDIKQKYDRVCDLPSHYDSIDALMIRMLIAKGVDIEFLGYTELKKDGLITIRSIDSFIRFSLNYPTGCIIRLESGEQKEFILESINIDSQNVSVGRLIYALNQIHAYIDFILGNINQTAMEYSLCESVDEAIKCAILERGGHTHDNLISELKEQLSENVIIKGEKKYFP